MDPELLKRAQAAIARALGWLRQHDTHISQTEDLIAHYKAPYLYAVLGDPVRARYYVDRMSTHYLQPDGDFRTARLNKGWADAPVMPAVRYLYPNGWIVVGLRKLGAYGPAARGVEFMRRFQSPALGGFFSRFDVPSGQVDTRYLDTSSTAAGGLALLACGFTQEAARAGDFILRLLEAQPQPDRHLYTSWEAGEGLMSDVWREGDARLPGGRKQFCLSVEADPLKELTWLAGKAMKFLAKLYDQTAEIKYLDGAIALFDFFHHLGEGRWQNTGSCKIMWSSAELYRHTGAQRFADTAQGICHALCQTQHPSGLWVHTAIGQHPEDQPLGISIDIAQELCAEMLDVMFELSPSEISESGS
jgi:hypothetical protein